MNKKIISYFLVLVILFALIFIIPSLFHKEQPKELNDEEKQILVISSYSNFAWVVTMNKKVIFDDGTIYTWEYSEEEYGIDDIYKYTDKEFMLKNGKKLDKKVNTKDLEQIKKYIKNVEETDDYKCMGADQGIYNIYVVKNNEEILINSRGDCIKEIEKYKPLVDLIKKYIN